MSAHTHTAVNIEKALFSDPEELATAIREYMPQKMALGVIDAPDHAHALAEMLMIVSRAFCALHGTDTGPSAQAAMADLRELSVQADSIVDAACDAAIKAWQEDAA